MRSFGRALVTAGARALASVEGRIVHDADSHIMETAEMLADFATTRVKNHLLGFDGAASVATNVNDIARTLARHRDPLLGSRRPARGSTLVTLKITWASWRTVRGAEPGDLHTGHE